MGDFDIRIPHLTPHSRNTDLNDYDYDYDSTLNSVFSSQSERQIQERSQGQNAGGSGKYQGPVRVRYT